LLFLLERADQRLKMSSSVSSLPGAPALLLLCLPCTLCTHCTFLAHSLHTALHLAIHPSKWEWWVLFARPLAAALDPKWVSVRHRGHPVGRASGRELPLFQQFQRSQLLTPRRKLPLRSTANPRCQMDADACSIMLTSALYA